MRHTSPLQNTSTLISDAERGLGQDEFFFVLQPKLRLQENRLSGFESLIRWRHPEGGVLEPAYFLSVVEDSALAGRFTDLLIARAANTLVRWKLAGRGDLSLAINLSALELGRKDLPGRLNALFASLGVDPGAFEIELTGVVHPDQLDWLVDVIQAVQAVGVHVALDDVGAGFNSLTLLQQLPVNIVKFDRSLIRQVTVNEESRRMVETLVRLAQNHGKRIVLTGLETSEQFAWAKTLPDIEGQGFFISEPIDEAEIDDVFFRPANGYQTMSGR
ncbi:EAL domain-containing protein [Paraburkholderia rhizosphaerae]|uniref:EAL domain-containing protein (Putative c-di-GMP-specific phosphodiesterase class I) n=1 Tax=Paraburkholderia rhizosphaerae TaxID=480658 RepID=A0A4R8LJI0_9BURK|nr:EAL domain-containing protein [Paraburkholderia rhizosphaerae]TDY43930.1 EAL domain-containing protein (putative c-di-GMP-specific phosphodiesterase class I) [Paraburkholderia rhizosphaerae]